MATWQEKYEAARKDYTLAKEEYRLAESSLARASARLNLTTQVVHRLYQERIEMVNA